MLERGSPWLELAGGASWDRGDVLFLDLGLGTLLKAGLHTWDGRFMYMTFQCNVH